MLVNKKMTYRKISNNEWIVEVQENSKTKELYIEFPPGALDQVGWDIGDDLEWIDNKDGSYRLKRIDGWVA